MDRLKRMSLSTLVLFMTCYTGKCMITVKPVDTDVLLGHSTYLNCSTSTPTEGVNWYHYPVGELTGDHNYVYGHNKMFTPYDKRYRIERNIETYSFDLIINDVESNDAGVYVCQNGGDIGHPAQLVVLDSNPVCETNIRPSGFIGPNSCELQRDFIQISFVSKYWGNIPPELTWMMVYENNTNIQFPNSSVLCGNDSGEIKCNLTFQSDTHVDGSKLICQINRSRDTLHYYISDAIKVQYAFSISQQVDAYIGDDVTCSVTTNSDFCKYAWNWVDGVSQKTISGNEHLKINISGWHRCEADCTIKGTHCRFHAMLVNAKEEESAVATISYIWLAVAIVLSCVSTILITSFTLYCTWRKRAVKAKLNKLQMEANTAKSALKGTSLMYYEAKTEQMEESALKESLDQREEEIMELRREMKMLPKTSPILMNKSAPILDSQRISSQLPITRKRDSSLMTFGVSKNDTADSDYEGSSMLTSTSPL